jgi:hypothetical protein
MTKRLIEQAQDGTLRVPVDASALDQLRRETAMQARRGDRIVIGAALMLGGILWLGLRLQPHLLGILLSGVGLSVWLVVWLARPR